MNLQVGVSGNKRIKVVCSEASFSHTSYISTGKYFPRRILLGILFLNGTFTTRRMYALLGYPQLSCPKVLFVSLCHVQNKTQVFRMLNKRYKLMAQIFEESGQTMYTI